MAINARSVTLSESGRPARSERASRAVAIVAGRDARRLRARRPLSIAAFVILLGACGKKDDPTVLMREVATEVKDKPRVQLILKIAAEQPTPEDLKLRTSLEDRIDNERIGRLISSGGGSGQMDITVEVDNTADGIAKLRAIALDAGVLKQASFKVLPSS